MTAILTVLMPFVVSALTGLGKWITSVNDTAGKRLILGIVSILGVLAASALNGTPLDPVTLQGFAQTVAYSFVAFLSSHAFYHLFVKSAASSASLPEQA